MNKALLALYQLGIDLGNIEESIFNNDWQEVSDALDDVQKQLELALGVKPSSEGILAKMKTLAKNPPLNIFEIDDMRRDLDRQIRQLIENKTF